jgi:hypothetical protein
VILNKESPFDGEENEKTGLKCLNWKLPIPIDINWSVEIYDIVFSDGTVKDLKVIPQKEQLKILYKIEY